MDLPKSVLTKKQEKRFEVERLDGGIVVAIVCHDDECDNGHNTFSITAMVFDRRDRLPGEPSRVNSNGVRLWLGSCGYCHDEIIRAFDKFPEVTSAIKFHLFSTDGPMHYLANTLFLAGDKDCWGYRKGDRMTNGGISEGKESELEKARAAACWPDATLEQLQDKAALEARLPGLMEEFKAVVERLGFVY